MPETKPAKPERYVVGVVGTPDPPTAEYYVLNVVHDFEARVVIAKLASRYRGYGQTVKADELQKLLHDTVEAHKAAVEARNPKQKKQASRGKKSIPA